MDALTGDIIINTDASVTVDAGAIKHLVAALGDPAVGVASGRDISVASVGATGHGGEAAYVGYEMWIRERSEEHTSELQSLMRISYAVFCLKKKNNKTIY